MSMADEMPPGSEGPTLRARVTPLAITRALLLALAFALAVYLLVAEWEGITDALRRIGGSAATLAAILTALGIWTSAVAWRWSVQALGPTIPHREARRVFFVTQLGKYLPGGIWGIVGQIDAASRLGAGRSRVAVGASVFLVLHVLTGLLVAALALPWRSQALLEHYAWSLLLAIPLLILMAPPVLARLARLAQRVLRRPMTEVRLDPSCLAASAAWFLTTWAFYGVALAVLAARLAQPVPMVQLLVLTTGGFALAWVIGALVLPAPSGIGPREVVLYFALLPVMDPAAATAVTIACRAMHVAGDVALGVAHVHGYKMTHGGSA